VPDISLSLHQQSSVPGFSYNFYLNSSLNNLENKEIISPEYDLIAPMLLEAFYKLNKDFSLSNVVRSRARLTTNHPGLSENNRIDSPHRDYSFPHLVLIYYVNSVDGNTVLFDNENNIVETIRPIRGRVCLFDGSIIHASSSPVLAPRIIINNNIKII
jgi:hypothetical protein